MWIKICGTTSAEDARLAIDAGADALGFVFAPSPRRISPQAAAEITRTLPAHIERFGIFVDAGFNEIVDAVHQAGLTGVQLHGPPAPAAIAELAARLRAHFADQGAGTHVTLIHVAHFTPDLDAFAKQLEALAPSNAGPDAPDAILIDSRTAQAPGGTGRRFDWAAARAVLEQAAPGMRLIVAGGLDADNVTEAIHTLRLWGVDVVSGVESEPGRKDAAKLRAFVAAARAH